MELPFELRLYIAEIDYEVFKILYNIDPDIRRYINNKRDYYLKHFITTKASVCKNNIISEQLPDGMKHGKEYIYHDKELITENNYHAGKLHGLCNFYKDACLDFSMLYEYGKYIGTTNYKYKNNKLWKEITAPVNGNTYHDITYTEDGRISREILSYLSEGNLYITTKEYYPDGKLKLEITSKNYKKL